MRAVEYIQKDSTIKLKERSYKGVSHDAVIAAIRPHLITNGVLIAPTVIKEEYASGFCRLTVSIKFINVDNPTDFVECVSIGYGQDPGDKGPGKAFSYAVKTGILKVLSIETGENDEERSENPGPNAGQESKPKPPQKDPPPPQIFNSKNIEHAAKLETYLKEKNIPEELWVRIADDLHDKDLSTLPNLLKALKP